MQCERGAGRHYFFRCLLLMRRTNGVYETLRDANHYSLFGEISQGCETLGPYGATSGGLLGREVLRQTKNRSGHKGAVLDYICTRSVRAIFSIPRSPINSTGPLPSKPWDRNRSYYSCRFLIHQGANMCFGTRAIMPKENLPTCQERLPCVKDFTRSKERS